jgi:glycosyltransferase involved in cell wall biosynthesis
MTPEKGLVELMRSWPEGIAIDVIGDGPLRHEAQRRAPASAHFYGTLESAELAAKMPTYRGLVVPSRWFEGALPLVYLEGLSASLPVLAVAGSTTASDVAEHRTGLVLDRDATASDWSSAISRIDIAHGAFASRARSRYEVEFSVRTWLDRTIRVYDEASGRRRVQVTA